MVVLMLLGGCGSSQPSAPSALPEGAPQASAAPAGSAAAMGGEFCEAIKSEFKLVPQLLDEATQQDPARQRALLAQAKQANDKLIATAPEEQKRDVRIVIGASNAANAALATNGKVPPAVMKQFNSPEYQAASARVRSYVQDHCQIEGTTEPGAASE
jgi:hypothetical protein